MRSENEQVHYRTRFRLCPFETKKPAIVAAYFEIMGWVLSKERKNAALHQYLTSPDGAQAYIGGTLSWPNGYSGGLTTGPFSCLCTRAVFDGSKLPRAWVMEYDEPDSSNRFRHWHTSIGMVAENDDCCQLNLKVSYYTIPSYVGRSLPDPDPNIPRIAKSLFDLSDYQACIGETIVRTKCNYLTCKGFNDFAEELISTQRDLPLILITSDERGVYPIANLDKLAQSLVGIANVYALDESNGYLKAMRFDLFSHDTPAYLYNCGKSTLRIYRPGVDLSDPNGARNHLFITYDRLKKYGDSISSVLNRSLARSYLKGKSEVLDTRDIEWLERKKDMLALKKRMAELQKSSSADIDRSEERAQALALKDHKQTIAALEKLLEEETEERQTWQALANEYASVSEELQQQLDSAKSEDSNVSELENKISLLQYNTEQERERADREKGVRESLEKRTKAIETFCKLPESPYEALNLFSRLWASKIIVLPEAYESAKRYTKGSTAETWKALVSMATVLWRLKFIDNAGGSLIKSFQSETSFELAMTELKLTKANDELMRLRQRRYNGETIDITPHVKGKGTSKLDPLRIHFAFDDENEKIVIGHCGQHLPTSGTAKVK